MTDAGPKAGASREPDDGADLPAEQPDRPALPADPIAYDSERNAAARARGLEAPYIAGGTDPDLDTARREERRYLRLLVAMVVVILLSGFVIGVIANLATGTAP